MIARLVIACSLLLSANSAFAIYQCTTETGVAFQDTPCVKAASKKTAVASGDSLNESLIRQAYKEQVEAMLSGDSGWLCNIMDDSFSGSVRATVEQAVTVHKSKKQDVCSNYWTLFSGLNSSNRKWLYKLNITSIAIDSDQKKAVVKSTYTFDVNQSKMSSKGASTDTWILKDGHLYVVKVEGESVAY